MKYAIGVDFGTLSARAVVVDIANGRTLGESVWPYQHQVIDDRLDDGTILVGSDWALADPEDYLQALIETIKGAKKNANIVTEDIRGIAIAATACTILPVDSHLQPLSSCAKYRSHPHAYAKLWKHHRAQPYAEKMTQIAKDMNLSILNDYGGTISCEWALPKVMEVYHQDQEVYQAADRFMQVSDWLTALLTGGEPYLNGSIATYKAMWSKRDGYPNDAYFDKIGIEVKEIVQQKLRGEHLMAGELAGYLCKDMAEVLGLPLGIAVGMAHTDAHAAALGAGAADEGDYVYIIGTSSCGHLLAYEKKRILGVTGAREDGLIPGYTCYSAGQACVGDMLDWFVRSAAPIDVKEDPHKYFTKLAEVQGPGECGLIALDWWGGNRSPLANLNLSGLFMGITMNTKPEDMYRALLDSIAFGHRKIIDNFTEYGLPVNNIIMCGGIANKNELLNQIMADVIGQPIQISSETQATALGAAMCAATAMGEKNGGYDSLNEAVKNMKGTIRKIVYPNKDRHDAYEPLYDIYDKMYRLVGVEHSDWMATLRNMKNIGMGGKRL